MMLGVRGHPPRRKTMICIGGLFKIEGRPFRAQAPPGSIFGAKTEPKWKPGASKINQKIDAEIYPKIYWFVVDFGVHFWSKMETKSVQKSIKNRTWILLNFGVEPRWPNGRQKFGNPPPRNAIREGFGVAGGRVGRGALPTNRRSPQPCDHLLKQGSADIGICIWKTK